jgi:hypothetical protein
LIESVDDEHFRKQKKIKINLRFLGKVSVYSKNVQATKNLNLSSDVDSLILVHHHLLQGNADPHHILEPLWAAAQEDDISTL